MTQNCPPATTRSEDSRCPLATLSSREMEVAVLVSHGCTNQQIARSLGLSPKTIETYLGRIFRKLDARARSQVATAIGQRGLDSELSGAWLLGHQRGHLVV
jgi:DNA-binding NarL/FixJ family response regulator